MIVDSLRGTDGKNAGPICLKLPLEYQDGVRRKIIDRHAKNVTFLHFLIKISTSAFTMYDQLTPKAIPSEAINQEAPNRKMTFK